MKSIFVYCEVENKKVAEISQELLSAGKRLAQKLGCPLEAMVFGNDLNDIKSQIAPYGVDKIYIADDARLEPFRTLPHAALATEILKTESPQIVLFGATSVGRDLAPRLASVLNCGLTADCTILDIGDHFVKKEKKEYKDLLYAIRPAFGGSIMANIINWDMHPQMATVREGVMKNEIFDENYTAEIVNVDVAKIVKNADFIVNIIERHIEKSGVNLKEAPIIVAGGYGVGSKENFQHLMLPFLDPAIYPSEILPYLANYLKNPKASTGSDVKLMHALNQFDAMSGKNFIFELEHGSIFTFKNKAYQKGKLRRTRFECVELNSKRKYLFNQNAEIEAIKDS